NTWPRTVMRSWRRANDATRTGPARRLQRRPPGPAVVAAPVVVRARTGLGHLRHPRRRRAARRRGGGALGPPPHHAQHRQSAAQHRAGRPGPHRPAPRRSGQHRRRRRPAVLRAGPAAPSAHGLHRGLRPDRDPHPDRPALPPVHQPLPGPVGGAARLHADRHHRGTAAVTDIDDAPASAPVPAARPAEAPDPRPLVLVTVGTDHHPFRRLVSWADAYAREHPGVRVMVQHGRTPRPAHAEAAEFLSPAELAEAMSEAAVVVTHGGPGSIVAARRAGHLPVAVARDPELGEHVDDHQLRFVTRLDTSELVRACSSPQQLAAALDRAVERPGEFRIGPEAGPRPEAAARRAGELIDLIAPPAREEHPPPAPVRLDSPDGPSGTDGTGWPEVTAIVPTRDRPDLVRRTLRSITGQDYPGVLRTIVVFDNDDPDHTLADDDPRRPVRVMANTRSPGLAGARNTGILAASGELVAFCDDDDTWLPGKLRRQVEVLLGAPETEIVCCGIRVIYERTEAERVLDRTSVTFADLLAS